jgi:hypothetical protein
MLKGQKLHFGHSKALAFDPDSQADRIEHADYSDCPAGGNTADGGRISALLRDLRPSRDWGGSPLPASTPSLTLAARRVVLIAGPPGAGKTTLAHTLGLHVFDVDDPVWDNDETRFRDALLEVARDPAAQAAVIRSGATLSARRAAAELVGATDVTVVATDLQTCIARIRQRGRPRPPIHQQVAAARRWWSQYEPGEVPLSRGSGTRSSAAGPRRVSGGGPLRPSRDWGSPATVPKAGATRKKDLLAPSRQW